MGPGRPLTDGERHLAQGVFGAAVRLDGVRLHVGGFGRFAVTLGDHLFLPAHLAPPDFAVEDESLQALLVHELVHVWQFQTAPLRTLLSWACTVGSGGYGLGLPGYRYRLPLPRFATLGLERQASVVEHAFLLRKGRRIHAMPAGLKPSDLEGATDFPVTDKLQCGPPSSPGP